ncbi:MAG: hypothetical protein AABW73_04605 [Nanoarchaeota archaeon]
MGWREVRREGSKDVIYEDGVRIGTIKNGSTPYGFGREDTIRNERGERIGYYDGDEIYDADDRRVGRRNDEKIFGFKTGQVEIRDRDYDRVSTERELLDRKSSGNSSGRISYRDNSIRERKRIPSPSGGDGTIFCTCSESCREQTKSKLIACGIFFGLVSLIGLFVYETTGDRDPIKKRNSHNHQSTPPKEDGRDQIHIYHIKGGNSAKVELETERWSEPIYIHSKIPCIINLRYETNNRNGYSDGIIRFVNGETGSTNRFGNYDDRLLSRLQFKSRGLLEGEKQSVTISLEKKIH